MVEDDTFVRVLSFVAEFQAVDPARIEPSTRLEEDLGITGDDAADLLKDFSKQFNVDLAGIDLRKHFGPEGCNPLWWFDRPRWLKDRGRIPVTIAHLARVAKAGVWMEPVEP